MNILKDKLLSNVYSVYDLFAKQRLKTPHAIAIKDGMSAISYESLYNKVERLAYFLKNNYLKTDSEQQFIAICMNNSIETLIVIFAILKSGAAYVPIDPQYPDERIQYILNDVNPSCIILNDAQIYSRFSHNSNAIILSDDSYDDTYDAFACSINFDINFNKIAYVIYTSGSTGKPKGVMVSHANVINYSNWVKNYLKVIAGDRVDFSSSTSFDLTVTTSIVPLLYGATVVLCNSAIKLSPINYLDHLICEKITVIKITPSYFNLLCNFILNNNFDLSHLRSVILGGENLSITQVKKWLTQYQHHNIINEYGPTETTVGVTQATINIATVNNYDFVPLGDPCDNTKIVILNENKSLSKVGEMGEVYIGGEGVSHGYLNRPEITMQKFIKTSCCQHEDILYKTGDLVMVHENQVLEYIGRIDDQVKVNGFRIELGEIENALMRYEVLNMVAVIVDTKGENNVLVAYYTLKNYCKVSHDEIQTFLNTKLPKHMIPHVFVELQRFELTINGKLDKTKLPDFRNNYISNCGVSLEKLTNKNYNSTSIIASAWSEMMNIPNASHTTNFFKMGGNSIIMANFCQKLIKAGFNIKVTDLFQYNTIGSLANYVDNRSQNVMCVNKRSLNNVVRLKRVHNRFNMNRRESI